MLYMECTGKMFGFFVFYFSMWKQMNRVSITQSESSVTLRRRASLFAPAHATPSLTHTTRALEAILQTRDLSPELQELFILLGVQRALALVAIGQIADLFPELNEFMIVLRLCAKSFGVCFPELLPQSLVTQLLMDELHGHTRHGHPRHFDTEQAVLYIGCGVASCDLIFLAQKKINRL